MSIVDENEKRLARLQEDLTDGIRNIQDRLTQLEVANDKAEVERKRFAYRGTKTGGAYVPYTAEEKAFSNYLKHGPDRMDPYERKTLVASDNTLGGYLAPDEYYTTLVTKLTEFSPIRRLATVLETSGRALEIPKVTGQLDANWIGGEVTERSETEGTTFGLETIEPKQCYAFVKVSRSFLEDSKVDLDGYLVGQFAERMAKLEGTAFLSGNQTNRPEGILVNANVESSNSGDNDKLTVDGLIDMVYTLPDQYRRNAKWLMNRYTIATIRKMTDPANHYVWERSIAPGEPATLLGFPIVECPDMANVANAAYPIIFGDIRKAYYIVDRVQLDVQRLVERYAELGIIGFLGRKRVGGQVGLPEAIRKMRIAA